MVGFSLFIEFVDSEDMLAQLVWPFEFHFSSSFSSFRDAGGDRTASYSHHSGCRVACVAEEDRSDHGAVLNYNDSLDQHTSLKVLHPQCIHVQTLI